jgi:hypothetical protein
MNLKSMNGACEIFGGLAFAIDLVSMSKYNAGVVAVGGEEIGEARSSVGSPRQLNELN